MPVPQPAGQQALLNAVDDLSPGNAWAVGTSFSGGVGATPAGLTLIEHWNGTSWSIVPSPNPATGIPGDTDVLTAISGTGPDNLWAASWDNNEATQTNLFAVGARETPGQAVLRTLALATTQG